MTYGPSFDKAKAQIKDALDLPQRIQKLNAPPPAPDPQGPRPQINLMTYQLPAGAPGAQQQPMATRFGGAQIGMQGQNVRGNVNVGPNGQFQGAGANANMPLGNGQFEMGAALDSRAKLQDMQARYSQGPFSATANYSPSQGVGGGVQYQSGPFSAGGGYNQQQGAYGNIGLRQQFRDGGGAWTRKEGQNPKGGLNAKGRASLKAQGHDIKPPVSAKQAKKSPKAAARRSSFCARMSSMEGPMKDDKGRPTRKALSLRKWDC